MSDQKILPLRLSPDVVKRADVLAKKLAHIPELQAAGRGGEVSRSTVLRLAVLRGLEALEREHGKGRAR